jgi:2-keto-3-deoxy-L-rhamnonate aldolase RhmA
MLASPEFSADETSMPEKSDPANRWQNPNLVQSSAGQRSRESLLRGAALRTKTRAGCAIGTFLIELPTLNCVSALALAGFDFVVLDMEHSSLDFTSLERLIAAAHAAGIAALVRPYGEDASIIGKVLDLGANGIMAAHVDTEARARAIVEQARFPPLGRRSFSPLMKFDGIEHPLRELSDATYLIVQIEGRAALDHVNEIAAVPGVDALFVGPYDLALSFNVPPGSASVLSMAERATSEVPKDIALGIYIDNPDDCGDWAARGFNLQCVSFDGRMLAQGARTVVSRAELALSKATQSKRGGPVE